MKGLNTNNSLITLIFGFVTGCFLTQDFGFFSSTEQHFFFLQNNSPVSPAKDISGQESHKSFEIERPHRIIGLSDESLAQWCPATRCEVTDLCHPCTRRFLFILATERSGVTTLQRMLNSLPGIRLGGENNNMIVNVKSMIDATTGREWWGKNHQSWKHEFYPKSAFACVAQQMAEAINPPPNVNGIHNYNDSETITGFRSTQLNRRSDGRKIMGTRKFEERVAYIQKSFPCSRFVINIRSDVDAQAESQKKHLGEVALGSEYLQEENQMLIQTAKSMGSQQAIVVDSTRWTKNVSQVNDIVRWLGFRNTCYFESVFPVDAVIEQQRTIAPSCLKLVSHH